MIDSTLAAVCFAEDPEARSLISGYGLTLNGTVALDVTRLRAEQPRLHQRLASFDQMTRRLWEAHRNGTGGESFAIVERKLHANRQRDDAKGRVDLVSELADAAAIPLLGELVENACSAECDWELLLRRGAAWQASVTDGAKTTRIIHLVVDAANGWPASWGGPSRANELRRHVMIEVSHAAWRDRRVRRLVAVTVTAEELWADPATV